MKLAILALLILPFVILGFSEVSATIPVACRVSLMPAPMG